MNWAKARTTSEMKLACAILVLVLWALVCVGTEGRQDGTLVLGARGRTKHISHERPEEEEHTAPTEEEQQATEEEERHIIRREEAPEEEEEHFGRREEASEEEEQIAPREEEQQASEKEERHIIPREEEPQEETEEEHEHVPSREKEEEHGHGHGHGHGHEHVPSTEEEEEEHEHVPSREEEEEEHEHVPSREEEEEEEPSRDGPFVFRKPAPLASTHSGRLEVIFDLAQHHPHLTPTALGFLTMEPKALFLPHYVDSSSVLYVHQGAARLGLMTSKGLEEIDLERGDLYTIPTGKAFYILNPENAQRLRIFFMFNTSQSIRRGCFQLFSLAARTVLSGFKDEVLAAAYKVSVEEVTAFFRKKDRGPIISTTSSQYERLKNLPRNQANPKAYNIWKSDPDFKNDNGWATTVDAEKFPALKEANFGMFAVSLKAGAMLAPHWNPDASEIGVVTRGRGRIDIVHANGSCAESQIIEEGVAFVVPHHLPMSQIASRDGPFEFVGFSTSSLPSQPQFLAGSNSVLSQMDVETVALSFGSSEEHVSDLLSSQDDQVILPGLTEEKHSKAL